MERIVVEYRDFIVAFVGVMRGVCGPRDLSGISVISGVWMEPRLRRF